MTAPIGSTSLRRKTLELVQNRPARIKLKTIADDLGLPMAWLSAFSRGELEAPNVDRVQLIWEYMTGRELDV
jgi:hypothetical protein